MHDIKTKLFSRLIIQPDGCVIWTGAKSREGYGNITVGQRRVKLVHRLMWELLEGPIPPGMTIDHLCRVKACANVAHMEVVTHSENLRRAHRGLISDRDKLVCLRGHERNEVNSYLRPRGTRDCRVCHREKEAARRVR